MDGPSSRVWADSSRWASLARRRMIKSMTRALMRLSDRDSHKAALAAGGLLVAAPAATWSVLAVVHSSMAWRQTLLRGTSRVGVALPRANPATDPGGPRPTDRPPRGRPARRGVARCRRTPWRSPGPAPTGSPRPLAGTAAGRPSPMPGAVSYTHLRAHETGRNLVCRLLLEKKK